MYRQGTLASDLLVNKPAKPYLSHTETEVAATAQVVQKLADSKHNATAVAMQYGAGAADGNNSGRRHSHT